METYNIYCDESCHLEYKSDHPDDQNAMVLGAISCPKENVKEISIQIRELKQKHGLGKYGEIKWTKVSNNKISFYEELVEYFFSTDELKFRTIVLQDKSKMYYEKHTHDEVYYIMYYYLLRELINPNDKNNIFIDKKDTRGGAKIKILKEYLCNAKLDFNHEIIDIMQIIDSGDSELLQLADILIGAVSYSNRELESVNTDTGKAKIVELVRRKSNYSLLKTTLRQEKKFNIFIWQSEPAL